MSNRFTAYCFPLILITLSFTIHAARASAQPESAPWDVYSDTWTATDNLGRTLPDQATAGAPRADRTIGMFYFLVLDAPQPGPFDITEILAKDPSAINNPKSNLWGPLYAFHFWGKPWFGYYRADDPFVLRKHAHMLADAGVDVVIFDTSNKLTYPQTYLPLLGVWTDMRALGEKTPQVAFLCPFSDAGSTVADIYDNLYGPDKTLGWKAGGNMGKLRNIKGIIQCDITGANPFMDGPVNMQMNAGNWHILRIRMRNNTLATAAEIFWTTDGDRKWNNARKISISITPNDKQFTDYRVDLKSSSSWIGGDIYQFRLFPAAGASTGLVEIDSISVEDEKGNTYHRWNWDFDTNPYEPLFFQWQGKPLVMADINKVTDPAIKEFFTYRKPQPDYRIGPTGPDQWGWLEIYPQHVFYSGAGSKKEQMTVGVAQNAVDLPNSTAVRAPSAFTEPGNRGRSYYKGTPPPGDPYLEGFNFQQQWKRALSISPRFIFITSWNEWVASSFTEFNKVSAPIVFVDEFTHEYSRDIEPVNGGHEDNYYYQFISNARQYKGVRAQPACNGSLTIKIDGAFDEWASVAPEYRDHIGDAAARDYPAFGNTLGRYVDNSGRNDIVVAKTTYDKDNIYFYVRTRDAISAPDGQSWMVLFLDADANPRTGWNGFDYRIQRTAPGSDTATVIKTAASWDGLAVGNAAYAIRANEMEISIPRTLVPEAALPVKFNFKWADNYIDKDSIRAFTLHGDAAPDGRFAYSYECSAPPAETR